jgi:hypothetical protein
VQGRKKIKLVQLFTEMNLTVIISDVDTVWMRNPFEYFKRYPEADVLTSSDYLSWTHEDEGLEDYQVFGPVQRRDLIVLISATLLHPSCMLQSGAQHVSCSDSLACGQADSE